MGKRVFDLVFSLCALITLAPLLALIATTVRITDGSPVLFRQPRVGRGGRIFAIRKFRTMRTDTAAAGPLVTAARDPRITGTGRFLRRWKLDELPQLLDVLAGHMSIVGPRPEVPAYVEHWPAALRPRILSVRPGLTDPATLLFLDEEERLARTPDPHRLYIEEILPAKARLYAEYATSATLAGDLRILLHTLKALLSPRERDPAKVAT